jgi:hypothetical protein
MAKVIGLQSAEPRRNPNGPLEGRYRVKAQSAQLHKSENRSQYWRPRAQPDDRTWPPQFRTHRMKSVLGRARSGLKLICATRPLLTVNISRPIGLGLRDHGFWILSAY